MQVEQPSIRSPHAWSFESLKSSYDLLLLSGVAVLLPGLLLVPIPLVRVPLGLALALLAPGYALTAVLFIRRDDIDGVMRLALSFGLSAALLPMFALVLDVLPWGIRPLPIACIVSVWLLGCCGGALWQRMRVVSFREANLPPPLKPGRWWNLIRHAFVPLYRRVLALLIGLFVLGTIVILLAPAPRMTEFYILGKGGMAEDYPRSALVGEQIGVTMGIVNQERQAHTYRVEAWAVDPLQGNQRTSVGRSESLTLGPNRGQQLSIKWRMPQVRDDQYVELSLFRDDEMQPYRSLSFWLDVTEVSP